MVSSVCYNVVNYNPISLGIKFISNSLNNYYEYTSRKMQIMVIVLAIWGGITSASSSQLKAFFGMTDSQFVKTAIITTMFLHTLCVFSVGAVTELAKPFFQER